MDITENFIQRCSLTLGQFDSERSNLLVALFHHQNTCPQLTRLSNNLKEKFENLLTNQRDDDEMNNDTLLNRIELAVMVYFKQTYLSESMIDDDSKILQSKMKFSVEDQLNVSYCFLLAHMDDHLAASHISDLKLLFVIQQPVESLFHIYEKFRGTLANFFSRLLRIEYFQDKMVIMDELIRNFQLFIQRYEDFLITFGKHYKPQIDTDNNDTQTDALSNPNNTPKIVPLIQLPKVGEQIKPSSGQSTAVLPDSPPSKALVPHPICSAPVVPSSGVPRKGLCVIINIKAFIPNKSADVPKRAGSDKDVELIKFVFGKLKFTVLECARDFKKKDLNAALDHVDNQTYFGDFDCLVMFIMSHGLLHSFFTADSEEVIIRDIIRRYADYSPATIWKGKSRMFFIQACRSLLPAHTQANHREGVKQDDLSSQMLVAYSCSASEASKRSPTVGSIFIQILCIMILRLGYMNDIRYILDHTAKFVIKRDEFYSECRRIQMNIQRPEYIAREFSPKFRFGETSLINKCQPWIYDERSILFIPFTIWQDIHDLIYSKPAGDRKQ